MREASELPALLLAGIVPNLAYLSIGLLLVRALSVRARGLEAWATAYALGTGAASLAILLLRAVDVPLPLLAWAAVAVLAIALRRRAPLPTSPALPARGGWVRAVDAATAVLALLTFAAALGPETSWDGLEYHLPMVAAWSEGPIRALPAMLDAEFRVAVDLLFLPAVAAGQPDAAACVSACFALCMAALIRAEATRRASPGAGALAGFFALAVSFTLQNAPTVYVDLAVGVYGFLALLYADRWNREGVPRALLLSVVFAGFAANAKLHAAVLIPAITLLVGFAGARPSLRTVWICAGTLVVLSAPWVVKAALTTGNPFFPFLGEWFGTGSADPSLLSLRRVRLATDFPVTRDPVGFARYLFALFFGTNPHLSGQLGPLPLALGLLALGRLPRATIALAVVLWLLVVLQFVYMPALRFASPVLPFVAVAAAVGGARLARSGRPAVLVLTCVLAMTAAHHARFIAEAYGPRLAGILDPDEHRRARFPDQVNLSEVVARAEAVVGIPMGAVFWMPKPVYVLLWERNGELFFHPRTPPRRAREVLRRRGVRSLVMDVATPLPEDGTIGHAAVDTWIRAGSARVRPDPEPLAARGDKIWVIIDLD